MPYHPSDCHHKDTSKPLDYRIPPPVHRSHQYTNNTTENATIFSHRHRRRKKNMSANAGDRINLKVKGQDGNIEVIFRIKRSTRLKKLMKAYCDRRSVELNSIAFLFHGRRLRTEQTPHQLEMEDGDEIDAHVKQRAVGVGIVMEYLLLLFVGLLKFCEVSDVLCLVCVVFYGICVCVSHSPFRMVYETDP